MLFAAVCLVGCQSEQLVEGNETDKNTRTIEIFAEMEGEAGSRTALDGIKGQLKWQAGDQLSVFLSGKKSLSAFTINSFTEGEATFTGEVQDDENTLSANVAFYPYNESVTYNDSKSSLTTSIPSTQTSNGDGTFAQGVYPMMAVTDGADSYNFAFKNVLAGTQLYVQGTGQKITKVVMEVKGQPLAGDYTVVYSKEKNEMSVNPGENAVDFIELNCGENGLTLESGKEYVFTFVHFPMDDAYKTVTFTLYEENKEKAGIGTLKKKETSTNIEFKSNTFKHIKISTFNDVQNTVWVADKQNLVDAVKVDYDSKTTVVLAEDVKLNDILTITGSNVVLDGNGKTLTSTAGRAINVDAEDGEIDVTIKNLTIDASGERAINIINCTKGNVAIDNVTATCKNYAVMVATSAKNVNLTINDSDFTGLNVVNIAGSKTKCRINNTNLTCIDNNKSEGYGAIYFYNTAIESEVEMNGGRITVSGEHNDSFAGAINADASKISLNNVQGEDLKIEYQDYFIGYANQTAYSFSTLEAALKYAKDGETICLSKDVKLSETCSITKNITIDLNGHNLDASANAARPFNLENGTLTIKGGTSNVKVGKYGLVNVPKEKDGTIILNGGIYEGNTDNGAFLKLRGAGKKVIELDNVTYTDSSADGWVMNAFQSDTDGEVTDLTVKVTGGNFTAAGGFALGNGSIIMGGATITTTYNDESDPYRYPAVEVFGNSTIKETTITAVNLAVTVGSSATANVENCNVTGKYAYYVYPTGGTINVTGGTYNGDLGIHPLYEGKSAKIVINNVVEMFDEK